MLKGAYLIEPELLEDNRGFFARVFCKDEFAKYGLNTELDQCSISYNKAAGTLRGMHYQAEPNAESKIVSCKRGSIYDVILDLRPASPTYLRWSAVTLDSARRNMLYVPEGFAHGFQTLEDDTEVLYQMSTSYAPESARSIRWSDPILNLKWPFPDPILSEKDRSVPDYNSAFAEVLVK